MSFSLQFSPQPAIVIYNQPPFTLIFHGTYPALSLMVANTIYAFAAEPVASPPASAPAAVSDKGILTQYNVEQYELEDGLLATVETYAYSKHPLTRSGRSVVTGYKTKTLSAKDKGDIITIKLEAEFHYTVSGSVSCPRYYSSYDVLRDDIMKSYEETEMTYKDAETSYAVYTKYKVVYYTNPSDGVTSTQRPSLSMAHLCDNFRQYSTFDLIK